MDGGEGRGRWHPADDLRAAAILGVVAIHATSYFLNDPAVFTHSPRTAWLFAAINQAGRFSVPAFFLLAGIFTGARAGRLAGRRGVLGYLRSRLPRLVLPYLTWSLAFLVLPGLVHGRGLPDGFGRRLLFGWTFTGAYFLVVLIQLTMLAPVLTRLGARGRLSGWALCGLMTGATLVLHGMAAYGGEGAGGWVRDHYSEALSSCVVWMPFFLAGILIGRDLDAWRARLRDCRGPALAAAPALLALSLVEFHRVLGTTGSPGLAAAFLKPSSVGFALAMSVALLGRRAPARPLRVVTGLAAASYPILLLHGAVLQWLLDLDTPGWGLAIRGAAGPILLGVPALLLPWLVHRVALRILPSSLLMAAFGEDGATARSGRPAVTSRTPEPGSGDDGPSDSYTGVDPACPLRWVSRKSRIAS